MNSCNHKGIPEVSEGFHCYTCLSNHLRVGCMAKRIEPLADAVRTLTLRSPLQVILKPDSKPNA